MYTCKNCSAEVKEDNDYCPKCGTLFNNFSCENHESIEAEGVCLICDKVCCSKCGQYVNKLFLCDEHSDAEIYQSMAKVYGSSDSVEVDYLISMLENNGFHPLKFNRKNSPISIGGSDFTLFRASGEHDGHIINEIKILVPFREYFEAEKLIKNILEE